MNKILKYITLSTVLFVLMSCSEIRNKELFQITDWFVESLYTEYESYGMLGGPQEFTSNNEYRVMPVGRLVNVRIEKDASDKEYEDLIDDLKSHYKGNSHVIDVYRCQAGTIMIDCRN